MNFLIKLATRKRLDLYQRTIQNVINTFSSNPDNNAVILISIDADDNESTKYMGEGKYNLAHNILADVRVKKDNTPSNKIEAINRDVNTLEYNWDILINMSDDMVFIEKNWDEFLVNIFREKGLDSFIQINDGYVGDKLPTMSIMGREYYERFFYIYPPCYKSFSCDAEAMFVAQMLGKWHYYSDVIFKHEHPANNPMLAKYDETYHLASKHSQHDIDTYFKRMQKLFYVNNPVSIPGVLKVEMEAKGWLN